MKIIIASDGYGGETHGIAYGKSFEKLGHKVSHFTWKEYFKNYQYASAFKVKPNFLASVYYRAQNKLTFGPALWKLNNDLVKKCQKEKPDLLFIYRGTHIYARTVQRIKALGVKVFAYNNDDPFSTVYRPYFWRHFLKAAPFYDHVFYYRHKNKEEYEKIGCFKTSLLRASYIKERNCPIKDTSHSPYKCDVIFIGHYETDGRDQAILNLLKEGVNLRLYGTGWQASPLYENIEKYLGYSIKPLYGEDYNLALNSAKIALVFLSKINNDTYTRRCFEIPATGTLMLAEYSQDLAENLFVEGKEAVYFKSTKELVYKVKSLLADEALLQKIAKAGHKKLLKEGHEVTDRAKQVIKVMEA